MDYRPKRRTKCKNCNEFREPGEKIIKCDKCSESGCKKCIELVCCDCSDYMCKECSYDSEKPCRCYGYCHNCNNEVNRGTHGWPCRECHKWLCDRPKCQEKNKCDICKKD
jgi:hypothetical protein